MGFTEATLPEGTLGPVASRGVHTPFMPQGNPHQLAERIPSQQLSAPASETEHGANRI